LIACWLCWLALAGGSPAATHFAFASPKESKQRKGDPTVCVPSLRYGQPAVLGPVGVWHKLGFASNKCQPWSAWPCAPRRSQKGFEVMDTEVKNSKSDVRNPQVPAMAGTCLGIRSPPRPGWAEQRRRGRIKILDVRRPRSGLVSKISGHFEQRRLPEAKRRDPDSGSPFFWLLFFGEAKKRD
jgi:hypothetical protein